MNEALPGLAAARTAGETAKSAAGRPAPLARRIAYAVLIGYALLMFVPFAWSLITSFKTLPDSVKLTLIPDPFTFAAYDYIFTKLDPALPRLFFNSGLIAGVVTAHERGPWVHRGLCLRAPHFPGREILFLIVLATLMIPDQLRLVPVYLILNGLGLTKGVLQYAGVILVLAISATSIFLMRQYFLSIPKEIEEAARIDGASFFTTFWRVMLPLAGPAARGRRDPPVPGHLERLLLAVHHHPGPRPVHRSGGPQLLPVSRRPGDELAAVDGDGRDGHPACPRPLPLLPALLRRGDRGQWRQGLRQRPRSPAPSRTRLPEAGDRHPRRPDATTISTRCDWWPRTWCGASPLP